VWANDVTELGTNAFFRRDPVRSWIARGAAIYSIDPGGLQPRPQVKVVSEPAEVALPAVVARLGTAPVA
jgi:hypothetical protein